MSTSNILFETFPNAPDLDISWYTTKPYNSDKYRRCKIIIILNSMSNFKKFNELELDKKNILLKSIEIGCYNNIVRKAKTHNFTPNWENKIFINNYSSLIYEVSHALDYNNNTYLIEKVINGDINPYKVGKMSWKEWNPSEAEKIISVIEARKNIKIIRKVSKLYLCPKCGKREAYFCEKQIRGNDEGKDTFLECAICNHEWIAGEGT